MGERASRERQFGAELALWRALFISMTRLLNTVEGDVKAAHDLTLLDLGILLALSHHDDAAPMGSLAATFGVDPSVITYRLKRLEARGLATRATGPGDRRFTFVRSTRAGRVMMPDVLTSMLDSAHRHLLSKLEPAEIPVITNVFVRLQEMQQAGGRSTPGAQRRPADRRFESRARERPPA